MRVVDDAAHPIAAPAVGMGREQSGDRLVLVLLLIVVLVLLLIVVLALLLIAVLALFASSAHFFDRSAGIFLILGQPAVLVFTFTFHISLYFILLCFGVFPRVCEENTVKHIFSPSANITPLTGICKIDYGIENCMYFCFTFWLSTRTLFTFGFYFPIKKVPTLD